MRLVDSGKIEPLREMIDEEVSKLSVALCISRPAAYAMLLQSFGHRLHLRLFAGAPVLGCAIPIALLDSRSALRQALARPQHPRAVRRDIVAALSSEIDAAWLRTGCLGMTPEDVATAVILLVMDKDADVFVSPSDELLNYGAEWQKLSTSEFSGQYVYANPNQMLLFETPEEFEARRNCMIEQLTVRTCERLAYSGVLQAELEDF